MMRKFFVLSVLFYTTHAEGVLESAGHAVQNVAGQGVDAVKNAGSQAVAGVSNLAGQGTDAVSGLANKGWGAVSGAWSDTSNYFSGKYHNAMDLAATTKDDVNGKVGDTKKYLSGVADNSDVFMNAAKNSSNLRAQEALRNINTWKDEANNFEAQNKDLSQDDYVRKWNSWVQSKKDAGLDDIMAVGKNIKNGAVTFSTLSTIGLTLAISMLIKMYSM